MGKSLYTIIENCGNKIKKNVKAAGLAGIVALTAFTGCESINENILLGTVIKGNAPYSKTKDGAYQASVVGDMFIAQGNADAGKNDNKPNPKYADEMNQDFIFAFTGVEDDNNNGSYSLNEFRGLKKTLFLGDDKIGFCLYDTAKRGDLRFVLKKIVEDEEVVIRDVKDKDLKKGRTRIRDPPYALSNGKYIAEWFRDGVLLGKTEVECR